MATFLNFRGYRGSLFKLGNTVQTTNYFSLLSFLSRNRNLTLFSGKGKKKSMQSLQEGQKVCVSPFPPGPVPELAPNCEPLQKQKPSQSHGNQQQWHQRKFWVTQLLKVVKASTNTNPKAPLAIWRGKNKKHNELEGSQRQLKVKLKVSGVGCIPRESPHL